VRVIGVGTHILRLLRGDVSTAITALRRYREVRYAEPDYIGHQNATPNDPSFSLQWGSSNTGQSVNGITGTAGADDRALAAWGVSIGSRSIVIGETDSGVDYNHPDLAANVWSNPGGIGGCAGGTHGYNFVAGNCNPMDDETVYGGHGTHVAGILGAVGNNGIGVAGMNWQTTILPVKWTDSSGSGNTSTLISALDWLLKAKQAGVNVRVVNDSATFVGTAYSQALSDEIDLLGTNDILFVTAAGNTGQNNDNLAYRRYPCGYDRPTEICVTASNQNDALPSWANYGANTVDLAAPGDNIYSTLRNGTYGYISGGSMASPQVAGAAALVLSRGYMSASSLKADILNNVDALPSLSGLVRTGGRLDVCKALPGCTKPLITSVGPADGATSVPASAVAYAVFNDAMDHTSMAGAFSLVRTSDGSAVAGTVTFFGDMVPIFNPASPLAPGTQYTASISTAAMDQAGAHLAAAKTWMFTTATGPVVSSVSPSSNAVGVYPNTIVYEVFSAPMNEPATQAAFSLASAGGGPSVTGSFSWFGPTVMIFTPNSDLGTGVQYTASVSNAAKDQNGNALAAPKSWQFTTINQPIIDQVSPPVGAAGVGTGSPVYAIFSEAMDHASTAAALTLKRTSDNSPVAGAVVWYGDRVPIFVPSSALAPNTTYTATIAGSALDQSGRALANPTSWQFTTGSTASSSTARSSAPARLFKTLNASSRSATRRLTRTHTRSTDHRRLLKPNKLRRAIPHPLGEGIRQLELQLQRYLARDFSSR
jgi:subtilisin family serine protease